MTLTELRTYLREHTATSSTVLSDANTAFFVNGAIDQMQQAHLWRVQETVSTDLTYAANAASIALPTNFICERAVYLKTTNTTPSSLYAYVQKLARDGWFEASPASSRVDQVFPQTAMPGSGAVSEQLYAIWDELLWLLPTPSVGVTVVLDYYGRTAALSGASDHNAFTDVYGHVVRQGALAEAYAYLHEDERAMAAQLRFEQLLQKAILDDKTLAMSGPVPRRGV